MTISNMYQTSPLHIRSLVAGFAGNILEWYDFTVYAYFATVIGKHFFPSDDKIASLIAAFGVFAAGYLMRPLGGFLFGVIGDKMGRKRALVLSILFMAIPTTLLGCLPTHAQWGWVSAALLVLLRLFQGLSVGGEFTGSISFLVEKAREGKRGFYGSWSTFGVIGGMLLGSGVGALITTILSPHQINQFGWRIPFLLGFVVGVAGLYLRKGMDQGDVVETLRQTDDLSQSPVREFLKMHLNTGARIFFFNWGFAVSIYMVFVYLTAFLHSFLNVPMHRALTANTLSMLVMMCLIPLMGMLSDRFGRKPMLLLGLSAFILFSFPLFALLFNQNFVSILLAMLGFAVMESMLQGVAPAFMAEAFPSRIRYTSLSVSYNAAMALFGGTAPLAATWLVKIAGNNHWMPAGYLVFSTLVGLIAVLSFQETAHKSLI